MASQSEIEIESRYCGPPGVGNGGIVCAILADHCGPSLEVTLRRPAPLERPMTVRADGAEGVFALVHGETTIAFARRVAIELDVPVTPSWAETVAAGRRAAAAPHPFPQCFVCGPARREGDGLRALAGRVFGRPGLFAAPWRPHACFGDASGRVSERFLWAALDCPGGMAALDGRARPIVLGRLTGRLDGSVRVGEACTVLGWTIAQRGRRHEVGSAIVDASGRVCGRARATWIELDQAPAAVA